MRFWEKNSFSLKRIKLNKNRQTNRHPVVDVHPTTTTRGYQPETDRSSGQNIEMGPSLAPEVCGVRIGDDTLTASRTTPGRGNLTITVRPLDLRQTSLEELPPAYIELFNN
jgi:hypothetical protein